MLQVAAVVAATVGTKALGLFIAPDRPSLFLFFAAVVSSSWFAGPGPGWLSVGLSLLASWIVAVLFTPYLGLKLLPELAKPHAHGNPDAIYDTRIYRALRRVIAFALRGPGRSTRG